MIEREQEFDRCIEKIDAFLPYIDNWATCDSMKPKILKKEPKKLLKHIKRWINSNDVYAVRYSIEYYINMMRAWYFATALAKRYKDMLPYIENRVIDV